MNSGARTNRGLYGGETWRVEGLMRDIVRKHGSSERFLTFSFPLYNYLPDLRFQPNGKITAIMLT